VTNVTSQEVARYASSDNLNRFCKKKAADSEQIIASDYGDH
jgi:hypothetical protein